MNWDFIEARYIPEPNSGCWLWLGEMNRNGYGRFKSPASGRYVMAHRISYQLDIGRAVRKDMVLDHKCRVRGCINPAHLQVRTSRTNTLLGVGPTAHNANKSHCLNGHRFAGKNLHVDSAGKRVCRTCKAIRAGRYRRQKHQLHSATS